MESTDTPRHHFAGRIVRRIERAAPEAVRALSNVPTAFVLDRLGKLGAMQASIAAVAPGMRVCGPAVTCLGADVAVRRMAGLLAQPGDVLVVAGGGASGRACFGEFTARQLRAAGIAGAVVDGLVRDTAGLAEIGFPTFAHGSSPLNFSYPTAELGAVNVPISCGNQVVFPGDLISADEDGVIVVPRVTADRYGRRLQQDHLADVERRATDVAIPATVVDGLIARGYRLEQHEETE